MISDEKRQLKIAMGISKLGKSKDIYAEKKTVKLQY